MYRKSRITKSRCPLTKSIRYPDRVAADLALAIIQNRGPRRGQPDMVRSYECPDGGCGGYHITPSEQRNSHSG
jgi:hypothetical protein